LLSSGNWVEMTRVKSPSISPSCARSGSDILELVCRRVAHPRT